MNLLVLAANGLLIMVLLGAIVYLIIRRVQIKKTEDFEDRDN